MREFFLADTNAVIVCACVLVPMIDGEFLRLSWLPPCQALDEIVQKVQTMELCHVESADGFKLAIGPNHVQSLLHNLQVLLLVQTESTQMHTRNAVCSQLNAFVSELCDVFWTTLEQVMDTSCR